MWIALILICSVWASNAPKSKCRFPSGPYVPPKAPPNEYYELCPKLCPTENCSALWTKIKCQPEPECCPPPAFRCKEGLFRNDEGKCVTSYECIGQPPPCGYNEEPVSCKSCPPKFCNRSYTDYRCEKDAACQSGCDCIKDYLRNSSGICVPSNECDKTKPKCGVNETEVECLSCPPLSCNISYTSYICEKPLPCIPGCDCKKDYLRNNDNECVFNEDCPPPPQATDPPAKPKCGVNETEVECLSCPPLSCNISYTSYICEKPLPCIPGCDCKKDYLRNNDNECVFNEDCPPPPQATDPPEKPKCGVNETEVECFSCPPLSCNISYTSYICEKPLPCIPGCDCKTDYLRNNDNECVFNEDCPPPPQASDPPELECGYNEKPISCKRFCPPQDCEAQWLNYLCAFQDTCEPGCVCLDGHLRNTSQICIPIEECPPSPIITITGPGISEPPVTSSLSPTTTTTPATSYSFSSSNSTSSSISSTSSSSSSQSSNSQSSSQVITRTSPNKSLFSSQLSSSQSSSSSSSSTSSTSSTSSISSSEESPADKPQCGVNETNVDCTFKCPHHYCPDSDDRTEYACKPPRECPSGCGCALGYRYKSYDDHTCVLAEDCPPVECTRPNEEWTRCPVGCWTDSCEDADKQGGTCNELVHNCQPKCACKEGYHRNASDVCVPKSECPNNCGPNEQYVPCKAGCPTDYCPQSDTRAIVACSPPYPCYGGCVCKLNYKLKSYENRTCIPTEECPPVECTRPNEVWDSCSSNCLTESCQDLEAPESVCNEFVKSCIPRCVCQKDFYRNESDICVAKSDCKKCGPNQRYVSCKAVCPYDYCPTDDSLGIIACDPPLDCRGGCICDLNYKRKSYYNDTCIQATDCPPVKCTRPNEVWSSCPSPCLLESCRNARRPAKTCNYLVNNCQPRCICKKNYFRNNNGECVPLRKCPVDQEQTAQLLV